MKRLERVVLIMFTTLFWFVAGYHLTFAGIHSEADEKTHCSGNIKELVLMR